MAAPYPFPLVDPADTGLPIEWPGRPETAVLRTVGGYRRRRRRRLAYLDSHFPWRLSGFRYFDGLEVLRQRPDTLFFSQYRTSDAFPVPVHQLREFPRRALRDGITDVWAPFLNFASSILGIAETPYGPWPGHQPGIDLSPVIDAVGMRVHVGLYPGGGVLARPDSLALARLVAERADTVISWVPELADLPHRVDVVPAFTDVLHYGRDDRRWSDLSVVNCAFAADDKPRKGLTTVLAGFELLDDSFHLHVVGPHERHIPQHLRSRVTTYGWLDPSPLAEVYRRSHAILSPVEAERANEGDGGITDGFPTSTVCDAMATGALAISANPQRNTEVLQPGIHYVEVPSRDPLALVEAIRSIREQPTIVQRVASSGSDRVRERLDVRAGVSARLRAMGLET